MQQLSEVSEIVRTAWYEGRAIVPLVGAGLSVDSGMPALQSIVRYIAKLKIFLDQKLYLPHNHADILLPKLSPAFSRSPWKFLNAFGWPDRFQLNFDVRRGLTGRLHERGVMTHEIGKVLDEFARLINPGGAWRLEHLIESVSDRTPLNAVDSFLYQVSADWKPLLREITGHRQELVDALFGRLARHRRPGLSHQFLAHLCNLLRIRTILTFNFDPLIEMALSHERLANRVFAMEHGNQLPSLALLDDSISVIKMHGGTHNILVDERVDYRISQEYRRSFRNLVGENPLLIVLGCSGNDRRLRELVHGVVEEAIESSRPPNGSVVWVYRAENNDVPLALRPHVHCFPSFDVGQTLRFLYTYITDRLPISQSAYSVHSTSPILRRSVKDCSTERPVTDDYRLISRPLTIFSPVLQDASQATTSSPQLMQALARIPLGYTRIWVDLEEHHSLGQVAAEIINQMRRGDAALNSFVSPVSPENAASRVNRALRRSRYVLVIESIDAYVWRATTHHGITSRFAEIEKVLLSELIAFLSKLCNELKKDWQAGDSCLVLHLERPVARHSNAKNERSNVKKLVSGEGTVGGESVHGNTLQDLISKLCLIEMDPPSEFVSADCQPWADRLKTICDESHLPPNWELAYPSIFTKTPNENPVQDFRKSLFLSSLCCYRRTRDFAMLKQMGRDLGVAADIQEIVSSIASSSTFNFLERPFSWTEGGNLWCDRVWRDTTYDHLSRFTDNQTLLRLEEEDWPVPLRDQIISQLVLMSLLHDLIARQYYLTAYLPSGDSFLCLEYIYHRISTLRYLAKLEYVIQGKDGKNSKWGIRRDSFLLKFSKHYSLEELPRSSFGADWDSLIGNMRGVKSRVGAISRQHVSAIRLRCLLGLVETWKRSESGLRRTLPSDQLIGWCETIAEYDLGVPNPKEVATNSTAVGPFPLSRLDVDFYRKYQSQERPQPRHSAFYKTQSNFIGAILGTLSKAYYERGDFKDMEALALVREQHENHNVNKGHCILDASIAAHWTTYLNNSPPTSKTRAEALEKAFREPEVELPELSPELRLRRNYLKIEECIAIVSPIGISPSTVVEQQCESDSESLASHLADLVELAHDSIELAREEHPVESYGGIRSPILEATADHGLFLPYKSLFQLMLGRVKTMQGVFASFSPHRARESEFRDDFVNAFRDFANARCGIGKENSILLAIADIASADAALCYTKCLYRVQTTLGDPNGKVALGKIDSKLRSAAGYLHHAQEILSESPQYVLIWRYFHATQTAYHIERAIWNTLQALTICWSSTGIQRQRSERSIMEGGRLLDRTRKGLAAIRSGLDYSSKTDNRFNDEWNYQWGRLACSVLTGAFIRYGVSESPPFQTFSEKIYIHGNLIPLTTILADSWEDLNESQGISLQHHNHENWGKWLLEPVLGPVDSKAGSMRSPPLLSLLSDLPTGKMSSFNQLRDWIFIGGTSLILRLELNQRDWVQIE